MGRHEAVVEPVANVNKRPFFAAAGVPFLEYARTLYDTRLSAQLSKYLAVVLLSRLGKTTPRRRWIYGGYIYSFPLSSASVPLYFILVTLSKHPDWLNQLPDKLGIAASCEVELRPILVPY